MCLCVLPACVRLQRAVRFLVYVNRSLIQLFLRFIISLKRHRPVCFINNTEHWRHIARLVGKAEILTFTAQFNTPARASNINLTALSYRAIPDLHFHVKAKPSEQQIDSSVSKTSCATYNPSLTPEIPPGLVFLLGLFAFLLSSIFKGFITPLARGMHICSEIPSQCLSVSLLHIGTGHIYIRNIICPIKMRQSTGGKSKCCLWHQTNVFGWLTV